MKRLAGSEIVGVLIALFLMLMSVAGKPATKDYISYWSAGKLLLQHADPYSAEQVFALEKEQGYTAPKPLVMRNPPWSLFLALPLGIMNPYLGLALWLLASLCIVAVFLAQLNIRSQDRIFAYCFVPFIACLITGQSSAFLLLGVSTFLAMHRSRPMLAGAALLLMACKPHIFFLFWPLLIIDGILHRRWKLLAAGTATTLAACGLAAAIDPHVWQQYAALLHSARIDNEFVPAPAVLFRRLVSVNHVWLQLVPAAGAMIWALWFYVRNRSVWDWSRHLPPILFLSVLTCPYTWMTDEVVLLPAILLTLAHAKKGKHAAAILAILNVVPFVMFLKAISLPTGFYAWTSAAWLGWYVYTRGWRVLADPVDRFSAEQVPVSAAA